MMLILFGIFFYRENGFLGSGDIKYAAIMILFLWNHSLVHLIGNIGILTIVILLLWWSMILGQVCGLGYFHNRWSQVKQIPSWLSIESLSYRMYVSKIISLWLDWIVIGYFLMSVIKTISIEIFQIIPVNWEFYFILSMCIFILRPQLKYLLTKWQYRVFPILSMCIYFWLRIQGIGTILLLRDIWLFTQNIWIYIVVYSLVQTITSATFSTYDSIMKEKGIHPVMSTIPYSVVIFLGFISLYFWDVNLLALTRAYFL